MGPLDLAVHVAGFLAPAVFLALALPLAARLLWRGRVGAPMAWQCLAVFAAGALVLLAGLWGFGRDGKMATYGSLVFAAASVQWLAVRGWK